MTHHDDLLQRLERANPVPDPSHLYPDPEESRLFSHLVEQRRERMDDTKVRPIKSGEKPPRSNRGVLVAMAALVIVVGIGIGIALFTGGDEGSDVAGGDDSDPAAVVTDYLEVWNAEDGEAVMVFYAEDAVVENHPNVDGVTATGKAEILAIEEGMQFFQGSTGTMEYINMEVSGNTVTFDNIFINGGGDCFSSTGSEMTIENDLITLLVWGDTDANLCP